MATIGTLAVNVVARTSGFDSGIARVRTGMKTLLPTAAATTTAVAAVGAGLIAAGRSFEVLNRSMNRSLSIMGNVSGSMRTKMTQAAIDVSETTNASASQAADAYFFLASAGLSAEQSLAALPQVAMFAQAGNFDLARATDLATDAQSALGLTVKDANQNLINMTRVTDVLTKANILANASVEQFSIALTNGAGTALKIVNKDIEEGVAVLAAYADQGIKAEEAGTAFGIIMRDLQTKAIENKAAFKAANVTVFDTGGNMRNMADIVKDLENGLSGLSDEAKKSFLMDLGFADKSVKFIQTLIGTSDKIRDYESALRGAGGTTKEVADKMLTPLEKSLNRLGAAWTRLAQNMEKPVSLLANVMDGASGILSGDFTSSKNTEKFEKEIAEKEWHHKRILAAAEHRHRMKELRPGTAQYKAKQAAEREKSAGALGNFMSSTMSKAMKGAGSLSKSLSGGISSIGNMGANALSAANKFRLTEMPGIAGKMHMGQQQFAAERAEKAKEEEEKRKALADKMKAPTAPLAALQAGSAEAFQAVRKNLTPGGDIGKQTLTTAKEQLKEQRKMARQMQRMSEWWRDKEPTTQLSMGN